MAGKSGAPNWHYLLENLHIGFEHSGWESIVVVKLPIIIGVLCRSIDSTRKSDKLNVNSVFTRCIISSDPHQLRIGIVADYVVQKPHPFHSVGDKYVRAVLDGMKAVPIVFPALGDDSPFDQWLSLCDGVLFTGAYSNVEPRHYNQKLELSDGTTGPLLDAARDATTLPLIRAAIEQDKPLLGLCRGFQEINVALGGTLHQHVHLQDDLMDHREDKSAPLDVQYGPAHEVRITRSGYLFQALNKPSTSVNSVHGQGIDVLAGALKVEAVAEDGLIEAFSLQDESRFLLGVQWHPEWKVTENPDYMKIFECFAGACRERRFN